MSQMKGWGIETIVNFDFGSGDLCKNGLVHFGFHDRSGNHYVLAHQKHFMGLMAGGDRLKWTVAASEVIEGVPNIAAKLNFPIYADSMPDGTLLVSNFGDGRIYHVDPRSMEAKLFVDGSALGMKDAGNCVVDDEGIVWVNEVRGCRIWKFDSAGNVLLTLGDGEPGFQREETDFGKAKFNWIYDLRRGPDGNVYVLDSRNFAVRMLDTKNRTVRTVAGTGEGGYSGDGGSAIFATFGSDPKARFDGPISLSLDEKGNIFVGDRYNHVVRMIDSQTGAIQTIAGRPNSVGGKRNDPEERDPFRLNLPEISSMDYHAGRLFVPTDLTADTGDLVVLRKPSGVGPRS